MRNPYLTIEVTAKFKGEEDILIASLNKYGVTAYYDRNDFIPELEVLLQYLKSSQKLREQLLKDLKSC